MSAPANPDPQFGQQPAGWQNQPMPPAPGFGPGPASYPPAGYAQPGYSQPPYPQSGYPQPGPSMPPQPGFDQAQSSYPGFGYQPTGNYPGPSPVGSYPAGGNGAIAGQQPYLGQQPYPTMAATMPTGLVWPCNRSGVYGSIAYVVFILFDLAVMVVGQNSTAPAIAGGVFGAVLFKILPAAVTGFFFAKGKRKSALTPLIVISVFSGLAIPLAFFSFIIPDLAWIGTYTLIGHVGLMVWLWLSWARWPKPQQPIIPNLAN